MSPCFEVVNDCIYHVLITAVLINHPLFWLSYFYAPLSFYWVIITALPEWPDCSQQVTGMFAPTLEFSHKHPPLEPPLQSFPCGQPINIVFSGLSELSFLYPIISSSIPYYHFLEFFFKLWTDSVPFLSILFLYQVGCKWQEGGISNPFFCW